MAEAAYAAGHWQNVVHPLNERRMTCLAVELQLAIVYIQRSSLTFNTNHTLHLNTAAFGIREGGRAGA